jgi:prepilin-type processing-associated H-X9-DG protein
VELLVVIAIIGILVALLLPAIQAAREAARRTECTNNIKNLALACHNYHDSYKQFPLNYATWSRRHTIDGMSTSWMVQILPFIEQQSLYDAVDWDYGVANDPRNGTQGAGTGGPSNEWVAWQAVPAYTCPSDTHDGKLDLNRANYRNPRSDRTWGVNNYKGCCGTNWDWGVWRGAVRSVSPWQATPYGNTNNGLDRGNGIFHRGNDDPTPGIRKIARVTDGTSTTFMIGEAVPEWCTHTWWWHCNGVTATTAVPLNAPAVHPNCTGANDQGSRDANLFCARGDWQNNYSFMSRHPGGANFAMGDASTHFVSDDIERNLYLRLGSMMDGQPAQVP